MFQLTYHINALLHVTQCLGNIVIHKRQLKNPEFSLIKKNTQIAIVIFKELVTHAKLLPQPRPFLALFLQSEQSS